MTDSRTNPQILTKIIATLGPASAKTDTLVRMIQEGVRVFRINFSHGKIEDFARLLKLVRAAAEQADEPVAALGDLCGPKVRCTGVEGGTLELVVGDHVEITQRPIDASRDSDTGVVTIATTYPQMVEDAQIGQRLLINDGAIRMLITNKVADDTTSNPRLICSVMVGGTLSPKKGINLPDTQVTAPSLTDWDKTCATWALEQGFDFLALSFVRKAEDIQQLNDLLHDYAQDRPELRDKPYIPIIAKIEMPQAIRELDGIITQADAVMVARGDLGVEMDLARVPILQKQIIRKAHDHGKPAIVATQMLESMIENASPTRAEISDVANAIIDGADATMLSGETAVGKHPVQTVHYMRSTAHHAEGYIADELTRHTSPPKYAEQSKQRPAALAHGVGVIVQDLGAKCVVMWTQTGGGVRYLSQNRLAVPIIALCPNDQPLRKMALLYGVRPVKMAAPTSPNEIMAQADAVLLGRNWVQPGDPIVVVRGWPMSVPGTTNTVQVHYVGDVCRI